ncbi:All-trans-hexaprenyl-diphosphate synthase [Planctomycetales bacterium 10988]|nr:All-trans-hexaprenyl-diphosphate synthase [Planctomycetales bacterium 10988]
MNSLPQTLAKPNYRTALQQVYDVVEQDLLAAEAILDQNLRSRQPFVNELIRHSFHLGGKRLRPILLLLFGKSLGEVHQDHHLLAAVVEMIHTATLVHDDILDEADVRRHLPTVNARWNNEASVLTGDYLFSQAFYLVSTLNTTTACQWIGQATNEVCAGELSQIDHRGDLELKEADYLKIIEAKTASLCACCCRLGVLASEGSEEQLAAADQFGRSLGIAFQIADDLLDLTGEEEKAGKSLGTDLEKQKLTMPMIRLLEVSQQSQREEILYLLEKDPVELRTKLGAWFRQSDALNYTHQRAMEFAKTAQSALAAFPAGEARERLERLSQLVVHRTR